jgi:Protein of unknown function (DUF1588)
LRRQRCSPGMRSGCWRTRAPRRSRRASRRSGCACRTWRRFAPITTSTRIGTTPCRTRWCARRSSSLTASCATIAASSTCSPRTIRSSTSAWPATTGFPTSSATSSGVSGSPTRIDEASCHGSVLLLTSIADRTSPVLRGKWVMEVLLGSPPPPPPPNVPALEKPKKARAASSCRCANGWKSTARTLPARRVTASSIRWGSRSKTSTRPAYGGSRTTVSSSMPRVICTTGPGWTDRWGCARRCSSTRTPSFSASPRAC